MCIHIYIYIYITFDIYTSGRSPSTTCRCGCTASGSAPPGKARPDVLAQKYLVVFRQVSGQRGVQLDMFQKR